MADRSSVGYQFVIGNNHRGGYGINSNSSKKPKIESGPPQTSYGTRMYGSADAFAGQEARVFQSKGKYYAESGRGSLSLPKKKGQLTPSGNPFSDFEKNWYIQQGFGDPTKLVQGGNTYYYQGVSPEARQLYLIATGGKDPLTINGAQYGPNQTLVSGSAGTGYQQTQLSSTNTAPSLQDPNQGRSGLLIRRAG